MRTSESIKAIMPAIIQFRGLVQTVTKDDVNPHFKSRYAGLPAILDAIYPLLGECGLCVVQAPDEVSLTTTIFHESGEWISSTANLNPTKNDPQGIGSAITYMRRYMLVSMLCLNVDDDDDGNAASAPPKAQAKAATKTEPAKVDPKAMTEEQYKNLFPDKNAYRDYVTWCGSRDMSPTTFAAEAWGAGCRTLTSIYLYSDTGEVK